MFTRLQIKVLSCLVLSSFLKYGKKNREIMPVKTVTSPSSARLHAVCQTKMGCQARHMTRVKANFLFHASLPCLVK